MIFLAFSLTGEVLEIRSPDFKTQEIHIHVCYSFTFLPDTGVDNEHPLCYRALPIHEQQFTKLDCSTLLLLYVCE